MSIKEINAQNFEKEITESKKTILLDFWAPWCVPCTMFAPLLEEISEEKTDCLFYKLNIDEFPEIAAKYEISHIPTIIIIKDGEVAVKESGVQSKDKIIELLDSNT